MTPKLDDGSSEKADIFRSGCSSQSGGRVPGPCAGFCEGIVLPLEPCDELDEPFLDEEDESISSLEESLVRSELLPELDEANRCLYNGDKGVIR